MTLSVALCATMKNQSIGAVFFFLKYAGEHRIFVLNRRKSFTRDYKQRGAAECSRLPIRAAAHNDHT